MKEPRLLLLLSQSLIGTGFFFLYVHHVRSIYETRTNIAHLTQLERESLLRREDALYYSFYKTLTEAPDFWTGCEKLKNVTGIEYPNSVNVLQRFHVLPELTISYLYHLMRRYSKFGVLSLLSCWRSDDLRLTMEIGRCDGQAMQFYLECVWLLGGVTVLTLYMYGLLLSRNILGGVYAVISYIMFHSFASKIYERPMARENFAFPAIFLQMFYLCICISRVSERKTYSSSFLMTLKLTYLTVLALLCWQFSALIFATQILIMMLPWPLNSVSTKVAGTFTNDYAISQLIANWLAYYWSEGNKKYIFSWQLGPAIGLFFVTIVRSFKRQQQQLQQQQQPCATNNNSEFPLKTVGLGVLMSICSQGTIIDMLEKTGLARSVENTFTLYRDLILHWGLHAKVNFVTSLAACNPDYRRMEWSELWELLKTQIVKPYCLYGVVMLAKFFRKWRKSTSTYQQPRTEIVERTKNYVLEDFLEEHRISMRDMSNKETEDKFEKCLDLLAECGYDYDRYKMKKTQMKKDKPDEHLEFMNNIKKLKERIQEINDRRQHDETHLQQQTVINGDIDEEEITITSLTDTTKSSESETKESEAMDSSTTATGNDSKTPSVVKTKCARKSPSSTPSTILYDNSNDCGSYHYLYSFLQMAVFTFLGLSVRKLFFLCFTQGCVIAATACSVFWSGKQRSILWTASLSVFLTSIINPGILNIQEEYFPSTNIGHNADDLDTMLEWIKMNTEKDAVFAGPIDIIGTVHLTTRRPIVNHAHLEMRQINERTEHVYSVFSRQQSSDIYNQCSQLKIQYLIISLQECTNEIHDSCDMLSIWDDMQPAYRKYPQFCSELANKNIPSFLKVFTNDYYAIIKMFSQSVQINLKYNKMPEKYM